MQQLATLHRHGSALLSPHCRVDFQTFTSTIYCRGHGGGHGGGHGRSGRSGRSGHYHTHRASHHSPRVSIPPTHTTSVAVPSAPLTPPTLALQQPLMAMVLLQGAALLGAIVGGALARKRRLELESLNSRLRVINAQLRGRMEPEEALVCSVDSEQEAARAYREALESALGAPSAAHPVEGFGSEGYSLAQARRQLSQSIREAKTAVQSGEGAQALEIIGAGEQLAVEMMDKKAQRAVARVQAKAMRQVGDIQGALSALHRSIALSLELGENSGDADVLGELGDLHAELGELEKAGEYYDRCIRAIQDEQPAAMSSTWDC